MAPPRRSSRGDEPVAPDPSTLAALAARLADEGIDVATAVGAAVNGRRDPCARREPHRLWWATLTPDGPATLGLQWHPRLEILAWGPGAATVLARVPGLLGLHDDPTRLVTDQPLVRRLQRQDAAMRIGRTGAVLDAAVQAVFGQRVTGLEARRSWALLVARTGRPAPGPGGLLLPPPAEVLATLPTWVFHQIGVDHRRGRSVVGLARRAGHLERAATTGDAGADTNTDTEADAVAAVLGSVPGIGVWTIAETLHQALGDPDAVPVGDYHVPHTVVHAFTGRARGSDAEMLALLEPFRGQRRRVIRHLERAGLGAPRVAPRQAVHWIDRI